MKGQGYSLWLLPTGVEFEAYSNIIKKLATEHNAPYFDPHVTLLGPILQSESEVAERVQQLAVSQHAFPITLQRIDYEDYYFRTLFIRAEKSEDLMNLQVRTRAAFSMENTPEYMPHLSLMYGDFPQSVKDGIIQELGSTFPKKFLVKSIDIYKTEGEVDKWHKVREVPLL